jgi:uroporphyrin-III C-methyltransferase / precorrin-2 dehydrogenase / sirohydrochlorin ferrochelatase
LTDALADGEGRLFPVFLKLAGRKVLLVGGGPVAAGKLQGLLATGATVTVVAPDVRSDIEVSGAAIVRRPFAPAEVNRQVALEAAARRIFVNAVDDPASASAYTGGVLQRGGVTIAVSTEGRAPALAGLLREGLEAVLPDELDRWVAEASRLREAQKAARLPMAERRPALLEALNRLYERRAGAATA